jgi:enamine deaminase RidA (YjgF/YER057c/UK114 family)
MRDFRGEPVGHAGDHKPTDVVLGVEALAHPELLIEVDAIAVVD